MSIPPTASVHDLHRVTTTSRPRRSNKAGIFTLSAAVRAVAILSVLWLAACGSSADKDSATSQTQPDAVTTIADSSSESIQTQPASVTTTSAADTTTSQAEIAETILGTWKSKECEPYGAANSVRRTYVFAPSDVTIIYELFASTGCEADPKVATSTIHSGVEFLGQSSAAAGATDADFDFTSRAITVAPAGVDFFKAVCGQYPFAADVEVDVTKDGCGDLVPSMAACPTEYDLVAIVDGVLYFGDRTIPLCSDATRPSQLAAYGVVKQP